MSDLMGLRQTMGSWSGSAGVFGVLRMGEIGHGFPCLREGGESCAISSRACEVAFSGVAAPFRPESLLSAAHRLAVPLRLRFLPEAIRPGIGLRWLME